MVKPGHRSRALRRVHRRTPGSNQTLQFKKRKPAKAKCGECGKELAGIPRERPHKMQKLPKTKKRPERPYGGKLCSSCTKKAMIAKARQKE